MDKWHLRQLYEWFCKDKMTVRIVDKELMIKGIEPRICEGPFVGWTEYRDFIYQYAVKR